MNVSLEVPLSSFASSWSQEKITRCHAWAQQSSHAGVCCTVRRERLVGNFLSITKWILVEILAGLLWLGLKMGGIN